MASRINTKFLGIAGAAVIGLGASAFLAQKYLIKESPDRYVKTGEMLLAEKNYKEAARAFGKAVSLDRNNPERQLQLGDALYSAAGADAELLLPARKAWERALEIDPNYLPAIKHLMAWYQDRLRFQPSVENFRSVKDLATRIVRIDPTDPMAEGVFHTATIQSWMTGVETDPARIDDSVKALQDLAIKQPKNPQFPTYVALAKVNRAREYQRVGRTEEAAALLDEAANTFDEQLKSSERNPAMYFAAATTLQQVAAAADPEKAKAYQKKGNEYLDTAKNTSQPADEQYSEILRVWSGNAVQQGKAADAEKVLQDLLNDRPNDLTIRLSLARVLTNDPTRWDEAITLLATPAQSNAGEGQVATSTRQFQETLVAIDLLNLRINQYSAGGKSEADRAAMKKQIEADFLSLTNRVGTDQRYASELQKIKGRTQMMNGDFVSAISTFQKALTESTNRTGQRDLQLINFLSIAYMSAGQTGEAKRLLQEMIDRSPSYFDARKRLTRLLLAENNPVDAATHIDYLKKNAPDDPDTTLFELSVLDKNKDQDRIKTIYDNLSESNRLERLRKAVVAQAINRPDEATRLLKEVLHETPADTPALLSLIRLQLLQNKKDEAITAIEAAIKAKPNDLDLLRIKQRVTSGSDPEDDAKERLGVIGSMTDEYERELALAGEAQAQGKTDELIAHLQVADRAAQKDPVKKTDKRAKEYLFQVYLSLKNWDQAAAQIPALTETNADQSHGRMYEFRLALARGEKSQALTIAQSLAREMPEFSSVWTAYGQALQANGQYDEATQRYAIAIDKQANNLDAYRQLIVCSYILRRPDEAFRYIQTARKLFPDDVALRDQEVVHYQRFGDPSKALPMRQAQLQARPELVNNWLQMGSAYFLAARAKSIAGDEKAASELLDQAIKALTMAREKWPADLTVSGALIELLGMAGKNDAAQQAAQQLVDQPSLKGKTAPLMLLADYFIRSGKPADAETTLRQAMGLDRENVTVQIKLADVLVAQKRAEEALRILPADAPDIAQLLKRYEILIAVGKPNDAIAEITAALKSHPGEVALLNMMAEAHRGQGQLDEAQKCLTDVFAIDPGNMMALYKTGMINMQRKPANYDAAMKALVQIRDADPDRIPPALGADTRVLLGQCYKGTGDWDAAIRELEAAMSLVPDHRYVRLNLIDLYVNARPPHWSEAERLIRQTRSMPQFAKDIDFIQQEASMWAARGNPSKALEAIRQAVEIAPSDQNVLRNYLSLLLETRNYDPLMATTDQLLKNNPNVWWVHQLRGQARARSGDKPGAVAELIKAIDSAVEARNDDLSRELVRVVAIEVGVPEALKVVLPKAEVDPRWKLTAALLYQAQNDSSSAIKMADEATDALDKLSPADQMSVLRTTGSIYISSKPDPKVDKAIRAYQRLLKLEPDDLGALNNLAYMYSDMVNPRQPNAALEFSGRAYDSLLKVGRFDPLIYDTHGWALVQSGKLNEGIDILQQVINRQSFPEALYHLAEAYLLKGYPEEAQKQLLALSDVIKAAEEKKQAVDPILKAKIDDALGRAAKKIEETKPQAGM